MTTLTIPNIPARAHTMRVALGGITYTLRFYWNQYSLCWVMDVYDDSGAVAIIRGVPLVTGTDLLGQFAYLELGNRLDGGLIALTLAVGRSPDEVPTFTNLGVDGHLYYVTP